MRYEKRFGKYLSRLGFAPRTDWFSFVDRNGKGFAHPDYFLVYPQVTVVFECKLTQTDTAFVQINGLYRPILDYVFKRPVVGIQVCHNLRAVPAEGIIEDPFSAISSGDPTRTWTMHWIG